MACHLCVAMPPVPSAVTDFFAAQNEKNCTKWVNLFADPFEVQDPMGSTAVTTKADMMTGCLQTNQLFQTISLVPYSTEVYAVGEGAAVRWKSGNVAVVNGTTCTLDFEGIDVFTTVADGTLISSMHGYFDPDLPAKQLKPCMGN
eukprot:TRINITY_DN10200_c0_g1_i1.p1 TRINITY_DN10200_c0_g1~~TRINITY_DN10200_c0_g1_i1.p1  ORF type:complete len:145 (-),score=26.18 TRINITY_DN10200_c0_g1_i1:408-842(-)